MIGGGRVYEEMLPYCNVAHVTKIDFAFEADTHFRIWMRIRRGKSQASSDEQTYFDLEYTFVKYEKVKIRKKSNRKDQGRTLGQHGKK